LIRGQDLPTERLYEPVHIAEVLADMKASFPKSFEQFAPDKLHLAKRMKEGIEKYDNERQRYIDLLNREALEEYEYDPGAFKGTLRRDCPLIRRCLNSPEKVMVNYQMHFNRTHGEVMLKVCINLAKFAEQFMSGFGAEQQLHANHPGDLGISELDTDPYSAYGVIGGGIRSHFLYNLHPIAFPNRSQNAVWVFYFLTHQKDYGYEDGSEFLMINPNGVGTQQNYFYPYDLFTFYASKVFLLLEAHCQEYDYFLDSQYRYVYLNTFLDAIADSRGQDINALKPYYEFESQL
jgi:hypothetical protein